MKIPTATLVLCAQLGLAGCMQLQISGITDMSADEDAPLRPPNAEPGVCYGREVAPAVIETVTEQVIVKAATYDANGGLVSPAAYRTETVQKILRKREDIWFKTPCRNERVGDFHASLQRALKVRGYYSGQITGQMDMRTKRAVRKFQAPLGLDSATLSVASARRLGLMAVPRDKK